jgi:hypothetical protein
MLRRVQSSNPAQKSERTRHSEADEGGRGSLFQLLREEWKAFRRDEPGQRFTGHYRRLRESGSIKVRVVGIALGAVLVAGGVVLLFMPGPGLLFLVFGLALLAGESKTLAGWLDRAELPVRRVLGFLRRRWKRLRARVRPGPG